MAGIVFPKNWAERMAEDPKVKAVLSGEAEAAKEAAERIAAQYATPDGEPGYADRFQVSDQTLENTDEAAHIIEWGSIDTPPRGVLRKAVEQVGARWVDRGG